MVMKERVFEPTHVQLDRDEKFGAVCKYDVSCRVRTYKYFKSGDVMIHGRVIQDDTYTKVDIYRDSPKTGCWTDAEIKAVENEVMLGLNAFCVEHYKT